MFSTSASNTPWTPVTGYRLMAGLLPIDDIITHRVLPVDTACVAFDTYGWTRRINLRYSFSHLICRFRGIEKRNRDLVHSPEDKKKRPAGGSGPLQSETPRDGGETPQGGGEYDDPTFGPSGDPVTREAIRDLWTPQQQ